MPPEDGPPTSQLGPGLGGGDRSCENTFLPMQARERYPQVLYASDAGLVTLRSDVRTPVVPSKILSIMASGRPVIAALRPEGDAQRLILESQSGRCVAPGDARALANAVLELYGNRDLRKRMGANGRRYAESKLSVAASAERYEVLLRQVVSAREGGVRRSAEKGGSGE